MQLEQQLTNLEYSQKLKELGVKQESIWYWTDLPEDDGKTWVLQREGLWNKGLMFSAFTVAELGELLRQGMQGSWARGEGGWRCEYEPIKKYGIWKNVFINADTEANARAKMLIYLIENNLIGSQ